MQPIYMDVTPLPEPVRAIPHLVAEIRAMRFDPLDPAQREVIEQAKATLRRLHALEGTVTAETADRMVLYVLGRAADDAEFAAELHGVLGQVLDAHGERPSRAPASLGELLDEEEQGAPVRPAPAKGRSDGPAGAERGGGARKGKAGGAKAGGGAS